MATQIESERDVASHQQHPKQSKPTNPAQSSSPSIPDSSFKIPFLPPELVFEILSRLPVKSLLQFRSVSKSWLALISSTQFIKTHLSISANNKDYTHHNLLLTYDHPKWYLKDCSLRSVLCESDVKVSCLNYPVLNHYRNIWTIVGSVNGLICLSHGTKGLCLWNPSIRKYKIFPYIRAYSPVYGFGYDEFHDDYKIVRQSFYYGSRRVDIKIYSLKDDSWRSIHNPPLDRVRFFGSGKFVNGKLHWANNTCPSLEDKGGWIIVSINLADEKWEKVDQPCCGEEGVLVLGVLGNNLSVITQGLRTDTGDVWVMKEYGVKESWTKMFTFEYPHCPRSLLFKAPFLVSNKDEILLMVGQNFLLYNQKDQSLRYPKFNKNSFVSVVSIYLESLVSPVLQNESQTPQGGRVRKLRWTKLCK